MKNCREFQTLSFKKKIIKIRRREGCHFCNSFHGHVHGHVLDKNNKIVEILMTIFFLKDREKNSLQFHLFRIFFLKLYLKN